MSATEAASRHVSLEIAVILFLVYLGSLVFTLVTNKAVVGKSGVQAEKEETGVPKEEVLRSGRSAGAGTRRWRFWAS